MKVTEHFRVPEPPPWTDAEASLDATVSPRVPGRHPCGNCLAMCCWFVLVERGALATRDDVDAVGAHLDYERFVVWIEPDGAYTLGIITPCHLLDRATCACTVHETPRQPRLCRDFDAHACFYRPRFETGPRETVRVDGSRWEDYRRRIGWSGDGERVTQLPEVLGYELAFAPRDYRHAARVAFDVQHDALPDPARLVDLLGFFVHFEGLEVVRDPTAWLFCFVTRRASNAVPAAFERSDAEVASCLRLGAAEIARLTAELGSALFELPFAALRERLAGGGGGPL